LELSFQPGGVGSNSIQSVITMKIESRPSVIPAQARPRAGARNPSSPHTPWIPAFAGMTIRKPTVVFIPLCGLNKGMVIPVQARPA